LKRFPLLTIDLIPVVAPDHPLAAFEGPIDTHILHEHVQLVLTDRSSLTARRDYGVLSGRAWRLADLGAKHSMLLAGLGWGNMPFHLVQNDVAQGRLKGAQFRNDVAYRWQEVDESLTNDALRVSLPLKHGDDHGGRAKPGQQGEHQSREAAEWPGAGSYRGFVDSRKHDGC
jgi:hypothetical protein